MPALCRSVTVSDLVAIFHAVLGDREKLQRTVDDLRGALRAGGRDWRGVPPAALQQRLAAEPHLLGLYAIVTSVDADELIAALAPLLRVAARAPKDPSEDLADNGFRPFFRGFQRVVTVATVAALTPPTSRAGLDEDLRRNPFVKALGEREWLQISRHAPLLPGLTDPSTAVQSLGRALGRTYRDEVDAVADEVGCGERAATFLSTAADDRLSREIRDEARRRHQRSSLIATLHDSSRTGWGSVYRFAPTRSQPAAVTGRGICPFSDLHDRLILALGQALEQRADEIAGVI